MLVNLLSETIEYSNDKQGIDLLFNNLAILLAEDKYFLSHILLNDNEIYSDFRMKIEDEIKQIESLQIILLTPVERKIETINTLFDYLTSALPSLHVLVERLYQGDEEKVSSSLSEFSEGAQWVISALHYLQESEASSSNNLFFRETLSKLQAQFIQMFSSLQEKDFIGLADLITYEQIPLLQLLNDYVEGLQKVGKK
ncbi:hypothetical protein [Paenibacillus andongensis]|uniref:hypothetical protein n=1 Tax=Paenibacillus andongensis TaxID=2975482 RepID=UPI0021BB40B2|nr:hypothetical protein [Paenibacillus andongensis]